MYHAEKYLAQLKQILDDTSFPNRDYILSTEQATEEYRLAELFKKNEEHKADLELKKTEYASALNSLQSVIAPSYAGFLAARAKYGTNGSAYNNAAKNESIGDVESRTYRCEAMAMERTEAVLRSILDSEFAANLKQLFEARDKALSAIQPVREVADSNDVAFMAEIEAAGGFDVVEGKIQKRRTIIYNRESK